MSWRSRRIYLLEVV